MIIHKYGKEIDTENMFNNHLYTYTADENMLYKLEVNFELETIKEFLLELKEFGQKHEEYVHEIKYDNFSKKPFEIHPYDKIIKFLCNSDEKCKADKSLEPTYMHDVYMEWIAYPDVYIEIENLIKFKIQPRVNQEKSIDLSQYLIELSKYDLDKQFLNLLEIEIKKSIEKKKLELLLSLTDNGFVDLSKQIENADKYLSYGNKNYKLLEKIK